MMQLAKTLRGLGETAVTTLSSIWCQPFDHTSNCFVVTLLPHSQVFLSICLHTREGLGTGLAMLHCFVGGTKAL